MLNYDCIIPVGDPHIRKEDIAEAKKFISWLAEGCQSRPDKKYLLVFMGDQLNDFGVARAEVLEFWVWAYDYLKSRNVDTLSLIGNHDMNQEESASPMSVYDQRTILAGKTPVFVNKTVAAIGFIRSEEKFHKTVMSAFAEGARTILCHAEFEGSQYESGTYAPNGFKLDKYPENLSFITGHIHKQQQFGKVWCIGTTRHLTRSDIGETKGVNVIDFSTGQTHFIATPSEVFAPFQSIVIDESSYKEGDLKSIQDSNKVYVEVIGTRDFCKKISRELPGSVKLRSTYTDLSRVAMVKESEGIPSSFSSFSEDFFAKNVALDPVKQAILKKIYDACPTLKGVR